MGICASVETICSPSTCRPGANSSAGAETRHEANAARRPQGGQAANPFPRTLAMISERPPEIEDRLAWPLGSRNPAAATKRHRHARRAHHQVHDPAAPARRARRRFPYRPSSTRCSTCPLLRNSDLGPGAELALHKRIGASLIMIYFCDPHSPWQRGTNETPTSIPSAVRRSPGGTQRPAANKTKREDHPNCSTPRETSTTDNVTMEGRSNLRCCNHH